MTPSVDDKMLSFLNTLLCNVHNAYEVEAFPFIKTHANASRAHVVPESCSISKNALGKAFSSFVSFCT